MSGLPAASKSRSIIEEPPEQRRTLSVLLLAQILSGLGLAAGITVSALLAEQMLGSSRLSGLPTVFFTIGSAAAAVGVGRLSQRWGRRVGLSAGYITGAVGSFGAVIAASSNNVVLLFASLLVYGAGVSTNLQARYAGADLAAPSRRGRAVSIVLVATAVGAIVGPNLVSVTGNFATQVGVPRLAGPSSLLALRTPRLGSCYGSCYVPIHCCSRAPLLQRPGRVAAPRVKSPPQLTLLSQDHPSRDAGRQRSRVVPAS